MKKKKPKLGDWVCSACGGVDFTFRYSYTIEGSSYGPATIDKTTGYLDANLSDSESEETGDIYNTYLDEIRCDSCDSTEQEVIQLKLEGPFPSKWSAHDVAEWIRKQKRRKA